MKKITIFFVTLVTCLIAAIPVSAADYGYEYPDYVSVSGGAYVEVKSSLGTVSLVFPSEYKDGYFGFSGSGFNICNIYGGTISGYLYTSNSTRYNIRASYGSIVQYQDNNGYPYYEWHDLNINQILNTNIQFTDLTDLDRQTDFQKYDFSVNEIFLYSLLIVLTVFIIINLWLGVKYANY